MDSSNEALRDLKRKADASKSLAEQMMYSEKMVRILFHKVYDREDRAKMLSLWRGRKLVGD